MTPYENPLHEQRYEQLQAQNRSLRIQLCLLLPVNVGMTGVCASSALRFWHEGRSISATIVGAAAMASFAAAGYVLVALRTLRRARQARS